MSKKAEPIWERVSGERLAQKQKEREEFFKSMPPRTDYRLALKKEKPNIELSDSLKQELLYLEEQAMKNELAGKVALAQFFREMKLVKMETVYSKHQTKADFSKWELFSLEVWAKRYQQTGEDVLAKLFQAVHFLKTHYVNSGLNDLPEVQTSNLQKALETYVQAFPESKEEVINEFDSIIYRQWDQVDPKYLSKLILGASKRGVFRKGKFKIARELALPFADKMKTESPRITGKKIYEAFVAHLKSKFPQEDVPEISTFRLWLRGKRAHIEELPQAEFYLLAVAIEFFSRTEPKKANEAIKELALIFFMQYDEVDPSKISAKLNRDKQLGKGNSDYENIRTLAKKVAENLFKDNPDASLYDVDKALSFYIQNNKTSIQYDEIDYSLQVLSSWIEWPKKKNTVY